MPKKVLLLGDTGKMGTALKSFLSPDYCVTGKNSSDFNANNFTEISNLIEENKPDIVINTVAFLGIDPCEVDKDKAIRLNCCYPRFLGELANKHGFLLIHFSTEAVFNDAKKDFYIEEDIPVPLNMYGLTKYGGDCFIQAQTKKYYIFRLPILFGQSHKNTQFVEKMLERIKKGEKIIKVSDDIISSPTYNMDVALEVKKTLEDNRPYGIYHLANEGKASLCELMTQIVTRLKLGIKVEKASYKDFPFIGVRNTYTPIRSSKIPPLRPWEKAVKEYCSRIKAGF